MQDRTALLGLELAYPGALAAYGVDPLTLPLMTAEQANDFAVRFVTDVAFRCPARTLARRLTSLGVPVFLYRFEQPPAVHTLDLDYVFGWPAGLFSHAFEGAIVPPSPSLIETTQAYWTSFATTGTPDGPVAWPAYTETGDAHLTVAESSRAGAGLGRAGCDVIDNGPIEAP